MSPPIGCASRSTFKELLRGRTIEDDIETPQLTWMSRRVHLIVRCVLIGVLLMVVSAIPLLASQELDGPPPDPMSEHLAPFLHPGL